MNVSAFRVVWCLVFLLTTSIDSESQNLVACRQPHGFQRGFSLNYCDTPQGQADSCCQMVVIVRQSSVPGPYPNLQYHRDDLATGCDYGSNAPTCNTNLIFKGSANSNLQCPPSGGSSMCQSPGVTLYRIDQPSNGSLYKFLNYNGFQGQGSQLTYGSGYLGLDTNEPTDQMDVRFYLDTQSNNSLSPSKEPHILSYASAYQWEGTANGTTVRATMGKVQIESSMGGLGGDLYFDGFDIYIAVDKDPTGIHDRLLASGSESSATRPRPADQISHMISRPASNSSISSYDCTLNGVTRQIITRASTRFDQANVGGGFKGQYNAIIETDIPEQSFNDPNHPLFKYGYFRVIEGPGPCTHPAKEVYNIRGSKITN